MVPEVVTIAQKKDENFSVKKQWVRFQKITRKRSASLCAHEADHARANGIGLSANQIGLDFKVFVAEVPDAQGGSKFYAIFNPEIEKISSEKVVFEEGCLSIPGVGEVERADARHIKATTRTAKR